ncbi:hypothetical protein V2G26_016874 [Clonostachys chloroleuca]
MLSVVLAAALLVQDWRQQTFPVASSRPSREARTCVTATAAVVEVSGTAIPMALWCVPNRRARSELPIITPGASQQEPGLSFHSDTIIAMIDAIKQCCSQSM